MIALSYSRLSTWQQCPRKFKLQYLDKSYKDDVNNPHFVRGSKIHGQLEDYTKFKIGQIQSAPAMANEAKNAISIVDKIFNNYQIVYPEKKVSVDSNFKEVDWFSKQSYYRGIFDLIALNESDGIAVDYKTGKVRDYDGYGGQLHLVATILMSIIPTLKKLTTAYLYVDHKQTVIVEFTRDDLPDLLTHFHTQSKRVNEDVEFEPSVNQYCRWCKATKDQCEYSPN